MVPLILRAGVCIILAAVTCVAVWQSYRRLNTPQMVNRSSRFDGSDITVCCICLEQLPLINENALVTLPCKHKFHKRCITSVFSTQTSCPLCRESVDSTFVRNVLSR